MTKKNLEELTDLYKELSSFIKYLNQESGDK